MFTKKHFSKKGISPLIAAVLLIAFTMAVALGLTAWITQFTKAKETTAKQASEKTNCIYKSIRSLDEYAAWDPTNKILRVYIDNNGEYPVRLSKIVVVEGNDISLPLKFVNTSDNALNTNTEKFFYINLSNVKDANGQVLPLTKGPDKVTIYTECDSVYTTILKPVVGWNVFKYNGQKPLLQIVS